PKEELVRQGDWVIGEATYRRRMQVPQARPTPRWCGRPRKPPPGAEGFFPQFYDSVEDAYTVPFVLPLSFFVLCLFVAPLSLSVAVCDLVRDASPVEFFA